MTLMVDGILVLVILEAIVIASLGRASILPNLLAGFMLLIAMRLAIGGAALPWVGLSLGLAGVAHLADLRRRWR